jgi:predicted transcriptional regulator of viral defense system
VRRSSRGFVSRWLAGRYILIAGGAGEKGSFTLFEWAGPRIGRKRCAFGSLLPEGLAGWENDSVTAFLWAMR